MKNKLKEKFEYTVDLVEDIIDTTRCMAFMEFENVTDSPEYEDYKKRIEDLKECILDIWEDENGNVV
jgi:hypothetical protein